jgi:membrane-associated phospholipid phosphatase
MALALLVVAVAIAARMNGFSVTGLSTPFIIVGGPAIAAIYARGRGMDARFVSLVAALAMLFAIVLLSSMLQYAATSFGGNDLVDHALLAADRALGLDWFAFVALFDRCKLVSDALLMFYQSPATQIFALLAFYAFYRDHEGLDAFFIAFVAVILALCAIAAIAPAIGVTGIVDVSFPNTPVAGGRSGQPAFLALRSGALREIDLSDMHGLITFPSGHAAFAIFATLAAGRIPFAFWPFAAANSLMLISTVTHGGHYFCDVFAGGALAALCWPISERLAAWRPAPPRFARFEPAKSEA